MFKKNLATAPTAIRFTQSGGAKIHLLLNKTQKGFIVGFLLAFVVTLLLSVQVANVFDPKNNIRVGTEVLAEYLRWYKGDVQKALLQYNGSLHIPASPYSQKVLATKAQLLMFLESRLL